MIKIQIVLFDGFDLMDAIAPYEVFCAAAMIAGGTLHVELVTAEGPRSVPSGMGGLKIEASGKLNPQQAGIILVPGAAGEVEGDGPDSIPAILGRAAQTELGSLMRQVFERPAVGQQIDERQALERQAIEEQKDERQALQQDIIVATVCGGSLLLAMNGLLEGRHAVTHHMGMEVLDAAGAIPVAARVVDDGNLVSGGGVTSGLDVALYLVERELGPKIAHAVEQLFEFERRGTVWRNTGKDPGQAARKDGGARSEIEHAKTGHSVTDHARTDDIETGYSEADHLKEDHPELVGSMPYVKDTALPASAFDGDWDIAIATPIGNMQVMLSISSVDGQIQGQATQANETVPFLNPVLKDGKLIWSLRVTKPMRLNLKFEVAVETDRMTGVAKAGMLPASKLTGTRRS
ncbi:DJ-1/PfpI family protein [Paenibacillus campinasensis]|uniref:DJ-1/PfpI family protein n=1 Tax=Paenibacillus campinasensis TaxID=66347 RepID=A0ABW9SZA1_9BACL|nr:DJ-1/PfpI family protein [Paenibacillus campinasensis]MUG66345.1 DJ-1/PfpI family protein [Paenibacillus campinasensis]